jgi:Raf kinase inhibitor-like YbhB/YbcL family protein
VGIAAALIAVFTLSSPAFGNGGMIPVRYTCDGANVSPALRWSNPPAGTRSFTLTMQDPDVPQGIFTHWVVTGIPATRRSLPAGAHPQRQGLNDFGKRGYSGPCPPAGQTHHYIFEIRAIGARGRVLGETGLIGLYARRRRTQSAAAAHSVRV